MRPSVLWPNCGKRCLRPSFTDCKIGTVSFRAHQNYRCSVPLFFPGRPDTGHRQDSCGRLRRGGSAPGFETDSHCRVVGKPVGQISRSAIPCWSPSPSLAPALLRSGVVAVMAVLLHHHHIDRRAARSGNVAAANEAKFVPVMVGTSVLACRLARWPGDTLVTVGWPT